MPEPEHKLEPRPELADVADSIDESDERSIDVGCDVGGETGVEDADISAVEASEIRETRHKAKQREQKRRIKLVGLQ